MFRTLTALQYSVRFLCKNNRRLIQSKWHTKRSKLAQTTTNSLNKCSRKTADMLAAEQ